MIRRLTAFMAPFMLAAILVVGLSACGKRGELRLPQSNLQDVSFAEAQHG